VALSATFVADFSSFIDAAKEGVAAMQGFKLTAEELGPGVDRGLEATTAQFEQVGRQVRQLGTDVLSVSKTFITAYTDEQDAVSALNTALAATGQATPAVVDAYAELATQFQNTTKYADEAIVGIQGTLTTIGKVGPEQMELALTATTNLASALGIDLTTAADMVAKALGTGGDSLGKLKALLGDAYEPGMSAAEMLQAINEKVGPAAQNELNTYNGQMANLENRMGEIHETAGKQLVEILTKLMNAFTALPEPVQTLALAVIGITTALAPVLVALSSLGTLLAGPVGVAIWTTLGTAIGAVSLPITGLVLAVGALAAAIYLNWDKIVKFTQDMVNGIQTFLGTRLAAIFEGVKARIEQITSYFRSMYQAVVGGSIVPDMIDGIQSQFGRLDRAMVQPAEAATVQVTDAYNRMLAFTAQAHAILKENSLFTTAGQSERIGYLAERMLAPQSGGGSTTVNVTNNITVTGGTEDLARQVADQIMRTVRAGTQLGTA